MFEESWQSPYYWRTVENSHAHHSYLCLLYAATMFIIVYSIILHSINMFYDHKVEKCFQGTMQYILYI